MSRASFLVHRAVLEKSMNGFKCSARVELRSSLKLCIEEYVNTLPISSY